MDRFDVRRYLSAGSPCLLAGRPESSTEPVVFCIVGRHEQHRDSCELTGFDLEKDAFVPNSRLIRARVSLACDSGGLEALLKSQIRAKTVHEWLLHGFKLEYAGTEKYLQLYFNGNQDAIDNFRQRPDQILKEKLKRKDYGEPLPAGSTGSGGPVAAGPSHGGSGASATPGGALNPVESAAPGAGARAAPLLPPFTTVKVWYASDRQWTGEAEKNPADAFNDERNTTGALQLGMAEVSIPAVHQKGSLEEATVFTLERNNTPDRYIKIMNVTQTPADQFFASVHDKVSTSAKHEAFVFVHGYRNTFNDSVRRTAQLAYDLNFDGAPIVYTWPSGDAVWKYSMAEGNAEWTFRHLKKFLEDVARNTGAERIHLIAHSMGNRVLANALYNMAPSPQRVFQQIVLAAPDIDTDTFAELEEKVASSAARVTVYASQNDQALNSSKKFHAYRRLGQSGDDVFTSKFVDTVDISLADDSSMGHSYYGDNPQVLSDLGLILKRDEAPNERPGLLQKALRQSFYWQMQKAEAPLPKLSVH